MQAQEKRQLWSGYLVDPDYVTKTNEAMQGLFEEDPKFAWLMVDRCLKCHPMPSLTKGMRALNRSSRVFACAGLLDEDGQLSFKTRGVVIAMYRRGFLLGNIYAVDPYTKKKLKK